MRFRVRRYKNVDKKYYTMTSMNAYEIISTYKKIIIHCYMFYVVGWQAGLNEDVMIHLVAGD